uniref:protein-tyrosine-phosphatase n=2 Tax=Graphocephala atropunctata TaxID=36148 RepID=A0A1B6KNM2_9HEMI
MKEEIERIPLRTILSNFLNHIDTLENQRTPSNTYESEFQELKLFSESIKGTKQYSCSEGEKEVNRKKNRYKDILPFDVSRVVLNEYAGVPGSDYINANYIKGASGSPAYIASQGPLPHTVNDFWRMVVQCEVQVIVMACNEEEAGKHKCENYWVEGEGEEKQFGMVSLRLIKASTVCPDFSVRTMRLKYTNTQSNTEERTVCQFHYSAWPDHGVPPLVRPLLDMVRLVRDTQASETLPVLIHCSAGCGRTGTICAIDYVWGLLRAGKLTKDFSLLTLVREMRRQRIAMVQTKEQYVLVHQAVRELFREQLRMIDSHPYENIDCNGLPLIKCPSPEPTYDSISTFPNNKAEEKQDEKEKEQAPPLPQKKRFQTLSSKQAKEVENLSERQRLVERAGGRSESLASPRIATLRSLFERQHSTRDSRQVSRSHSLGSVRQPPQPSTVPQKPIPSRGILRVPQSQPKPALPVKRSKSLRVLGSGDRCKLSIPPTPPCETDVTDLPRRLSLESNYDEIKDLVERETQQPLVDFLSVDSIVAGLGVRERRNSFRQAVGKESQESMLPWPKKVGLLRSYTSIDMRCAREKPNITQDTPPTKPLLSPKPNLQLSSHDTKKTLPDPRLHFQDRHLLASVNQSYSAPSEPKKPQLQVTSRSLTAQSMSLRLAPRPKREDCRGLLPSTVTGSGVLHRQEQVYSSGDSSVSASSDHGSLSSKVFPSSSSKPTVKTIPLNITTEISKKDIKDKQRAQPLSQRQGIFSSRSYDDTNAIYRQDTIGTTSNARQSSNVVPQTPPGRPEQNKLLMLHRMKSLGEMRKNPPLQNMRPVVYDSKGLRQNPSAVYGTVPKALPPPYVEPGKNAQKPRSSPLSNIDKQSGYYDDTYGKTQEQRHIHVTSSSRDMILPAYSSNSKPSSTGSDIKLNYHETSGINSRNLSDKIHTEPDYPVNTQEDSRYVKKASETRSKGQEYRFLPQESQLVRSSNHRNLRNERRQLEKDNHKSIQDSVPKIPIDRRLRGMDQTFRLDASSSGGRTVDQNLKEQNLKHNTHDPFYRENKVITQEYRCGPQESAKSGDPRQKEQGIGSNLQDSLHSIKERTLVDQNSKNSVQELYVTSVERRYQPSTQELNAKSFSDRRTIRNQELGYQHNRPDPRTDCLPKGPQMKQTPWTQTSVPLNESENPLVYGVMMQRGSRDDLALCASVPSRVKRHASVVLLRHSLIEGAVSSTDSPISPISVWNEISGGLPPANSSPTTPIREDPWSGAVGVDLDQVAASITSQKDGRMMRAALEALHLRKASQVQATPKSGPGSTHKMPSQAQSQAKSSHTTPAVEASKTATSVGSFQLSPEPNRPGVFRKQQQYL